MPPPPKPPSGTPPAQTQKPATRPASAPAPVDAPGKTTSFLQSAPKMELPKGGGAIRGIGETFQANPVTGTAGMSVPIAVSPGRRGFQPNLSLSYDSGAGNGPFGLGWSLNLPHIQRRTDRGLPRYRDATDGDRFVASDTEELVPYRVWESGSWVEPPLAPATDGTTTWTRRRYQPRIEGGFERIERWTDTTTRQAHWRSWSRENICRIYGLSENTRLTDPDKANHVFCWYLEEERDEVGNLIRYSYRAEDRLGAPTTAAERMRALPKNGCTYLYLKRILYGNVTPFSDAGGWLFEVVFDYGDHSGDPEASTPTAPWHLLDQDWPAREDIFSTFRSGFDIRCYRLCQRVLVYHRFDDPLALVADDPAATLEAHPPVLVRSTEITYAASPIATTVSSIQVRGWRYEGGWSTETLPALSFGYTGSATAPETAIDTSVQFVDGMRDLPLGLDMSLWQWIDLDGEGLTGLLAEYGEGWFYKRNKGAGEFGAIRRIANRPSLISLGSSDTRLMDVDGDGRLEAVSLRPGLTGFYPRDANGNWQNFRPFRQIPNVDWNDPNLRMLDLDGDGLPDVLISESDCFTWYPSEGREGWSASERVRKMADEERGPKVVFSSDRESLFLADMTGDGLTDIVRIRNGNICYWPNRGYGRFGAKVQMAGAPWFDKPDRFDSKRLRLADIDGSGPADILYLGSQGVRFWFNCSGNRWSAANTLPQFPGVENSATISVVDLLGEGTACLVWSSPLLRDAYQPLRFISLMGEGKPYLLKTITNNLGRVTTLRYAPSTQFYVQDREAGTPWATRLPFPVQVLEHVEVRDDVTGWRIGTRYAYHHGYYDSEEREFRGFGKVEQWDTEQLGTYESGHGTDAELDLDPVRTVTWFHTGAWRQQGTLEAAYAGEYFEESSPVPWTEGHEITDAETGWATMKAIEKREAARALKGRPLRQEVYAEDGNTAPYAVTANSYHVVRLQARNGEAPAVFIVVPRETLARQYERVADDPRTQQTLVLAYDAFGTVLTQATVGYPRWPGANTTAQQEIRTVLVAEAEVIHDTSTFDTETNPTRMHWHVAVPYRAQQWEMTHDDWTSYTGASDDPTDTHPFTTAQLEDVLVDATEIAFEIAATTGLQKRCLAETRTRYWKDFDADHPVDPMAPYAPDGTMESRVLVYQAYQRCFTTGLLSAAYGSSVSTGDLEAAGYIDLESNGDYWIPSGTQTLDSERFYIATDYTDPFGNTSSVTLDTWAFLPVSVTDALGNTVTLEIDPVVLQPVSVTDPNGNITEAAYDALGRLTAVAVEGDSLEAPTIGYTYEMDRWASSAFPVRVHVQMRTEHGGSNFIHHYTYSDGGGNVVQEKVSAEPGEVGGVATDPRWLGTGRTILNNKGLPVKQFEPFFSATEECEFEDEMVTQGVSSTIFYDPPGRAIRVALPNGTLRRVEFSPWKQTFWDENDTVLDSDWYTVRLADDPDLATATALHANTPSVLHLDALGRPYQTYEFLSGSAYSANTPDISTTVVLDITGNPLIVIDGRAIEIQTQTFDILGRPISTASPDGGNATALLDVSGQPIRILKSGDLQLDYTYDALRRRTQLSVTEASTTTIREITEYGESATSPETLNLRGKPWKQWDTAGQIVTNSYDFKGNPLSTTRRFWDRDGTGTDTVTWASTPDESDLETTEYTVSQTFDALNRVVTQTAPNGKATALTYNEAGRLETVSVEGDPFVSALSYNARGQREAITYGNGVTTAHSYDPETYRLTRLLTTRSSDSAVLQDLRYTYDPVGNITLIQNVATDTLYFDNTAVTPDQSFVYDALYRLTSATGREKASLGYVAPGDEPTFGNRPDINTAVQSYTQAYSYDAVGNILEMAHVVGSSSPYNWTRNYNYASDSNRLASTTVGSITDTFAHDDRGNIVYLPHLLYSSTQDANITVDFRDQMVQANLATSGQYARYFYDAGGQRVRKVVVKGTIVEERRYIGGYEVWTKTTSGALDETRTTLHVQDGMQRIAMIEEKTGAMGWTRFRYQLGNHLGTIALEVDEDGEIISYEEYHPYGATAWKAPELAEVSAKRYRYTGMERDEETGLQRHGVRYYAVWLGRWMSADPIGLGDGVNRFVYVHNTPICMDDPSGLGDDEKQGSKNSLSLKVQNNPNFTPPQNDSDVEIDNTNPTYVVRNHPSTIQSYLDKYNESNNLQGASAKKASDYADVSAVALPNYFRLEVVAHNIRDNIYSADIVVIWDPRTMLILEAAVPGLELEDSSSFGLYDHVGVTMEGGERAHANTWARRVTPEEFNRLVAGTLTVRLRSAADRAPKSGIPDPPTGATVTFNGVILPETFTIRSLQGKPANAEAAALAIKTYLISNGFLDWIYRSYQTIDIIENHLYQYTTAGGSHASNPYLFKKDSNGEMSVVIPLQMDPAKLPPTYVIPSVIP